jgi:hypothetical protein
MCIGIVGENLVAPQASPQKFTGEDHLKFLTNTHPSGNAPSIVVCNQIVSPYYSVGVLNHYFIERWIGRNCPVLRPPRLSCDFIMWGLHETTCLFQVF